MVTCSSSDMGTYCACFRTSVTRCPRSSCARVALSSSEVPNWAKAANSRYCTSSSLSLPATCFMALVWAALPTRDTERPTFSAGLMPALKRSVSRYICPSVMEMTLVGI